MPHLHDVFHALWLPARYQGPRLISVLLKASAFTAKEAAVGFAMGAAAGFVLGVVLAHFRVLQRGILPYAVASQTVPILVVAPMVVIYLGSKGLPGWFSVAVISAYLTFFPVTINTLRGAILHGPRDLRIESARMPEPGPGEVVVRVGMAGLCGTDYRIWTGDRPVAYPLVMGHEFVGQVSAIALSHRRSPRSIARNFPSAMTLPTD